MSAITYHGTAINQSPTLLVTAGEKIEKAHAKAVVLKEGKAYLAKAGENAMGFIMPTENDTINDGDNFSIQIKDIGMWVAGDEIKAGDELASDANGAAIKAVTGKFITAIALNGTENAGTLIRVQIIKAGYKA